MSNKLIRPKLTASKEISLDDLDTHDGQNRAWPKILKDCEYLGLELWEKYKHAPVPFFDTQFVFLNVQENVKKHWLLSDSTELKVVPSDVPLAYGKTIKFVRKPEEPSNYNAFEYIDGAMVLPDNESERRAIVTSLGGLVLLRSDIVAKQNKHTFGNFSDNILKVPVLNTRRGHREEDRERLTDYLRSEEQVKKYVKTTTPLENVYQSGAVLLGKERNEVNINHREYAGMVLGGLRSFSYKAPHDVPGLKRLASGPSENNPPPQWP